MKKENKPAGGGEDRGEIGCGFCEEKGAGV